MRLLNVAFLGANSLFFLIFRPMPVTALTSNNKGKAPVGTHDHEASTSGHHDSSSCDDEAPGDKTTHSFIQRLYDSDSDSDLEFCSRPSTSIPLVEKRFDSRLPAANQMLRFQIFQELHVPEEVCELLCDALIMQFQLQLISEQVEEDWRDLSITSESQIRIRQSTMPLYYARPQTEASTSRSTSSNRLVLFLSQMAAPAMTFSQNWLREADALIERTFLNVDTWFLVILLARSYVAEAKKEATFWSHLVYRGTNSGAFAVASLIAAYTRLRGLFEQTTIQKVGVCVCRAEVTVTNIRSQVSPPPDLDISPEHIADRLTYRSYQIDHEAHRERGWERLGAAHLVPMPDTEQTEAPMPCVGLTDYACQCKNEKKCPWRFLRHEFKSMRDTFTGSLWNLLPDDVRARLSTTVPGRFQTEMQQATGEEFMDRFLEPFSHTEDGEQFGLALQWLRDAEEATARADSLTAQAQRLATVHGSLPHQGEVLLEEAGRLYAKAKELRDIAKGLSTAGISPMK